MFKPKTILTLGIWLILIPFLGVPTTWRTFLLYLTGFILIANYFLRKKSEVSAEAENNKVAATTTFAENGK